MWAPFLDSWIRKDEAMGVEDLQYGDTYELRNGDSCVYVCRDLEERDSDQEMQLMSVELVLINTSTGEEHNINDYNDDLTHISDKQLDIVVLANEIRITNKEVLKEEVEMEMMDYLNELNSSDEINYNVYISLIDLTMDLLKRMYKLGGHYED